MGNNDNITMSRIAFERIQAKDERNCKWMTIIIVILIGLLAITNGIWLYTWCKRDCSHSDACSCSIDVDTTERVNVNYIGKDGDITNSMNSDKRTR